MSENTKEKPLTKNYLKDCFMQQCQDEIDNYNKDAESVLDKYSKLSIKNLPIISLGVSASLILLHSPLSLKACSQLIGFFVLVFMLAVFLIVRYYVKYKENNKIVLDIYDSWKKTIFNAIIINFGLFLVSSNAITELLIILACSSLALIFIQKGVKKRSS